MMEFSRYIKRSELLTVPHGRYEAYPGIQHEDLIAAMHKGYELVRLIVTSKQQTAHMVFRSRIRVTKKVGFAYIACIHHRSYKCRWYVCYLAKPGNILFISEEVLHLPTIPKSNEGLFLKRYVSKVLKKFKDHASKKNYDLNIWKLQKRRVSMREIDGLLVRALRLKLLTPGKIPQVISEWNQPTYDEWLEPTYWNLYQCFAMVTKMGPPIKQLPLLRGFGQLLLKERTRGS